MAKFRGTNNYIGAWRYVLLDILYAIPLIGWVVLLVHALDKSRENRMHYARSRFVHAMIGLVILVILFAVFFFSGGQKYFTHQEECNQVLEKYRVQYDNITEMMHKELDAIPND